MSLPTITFENATVVRTEQFGYGQGATGVKVIIEVDTSYQKDGNTVISLHKFELAAFGQKASFAMSLHPGYRGDFTASIKSKEWTKPETQEVRYFYSFGFIEVAPAADNMPPAAAQQQQVHVSQPLGIQHQVPMDGGPVQNPAISQPAPQQPNPYDIDPQDVPF